MNYEKKYKEALEMAKVAALNGFQNLMEGIFPELKEFEDERIRKRIIALVNAHGQGMSKESMLDWLKKQGEHANFRDAIQVGDKVTRNEDGMIVNLSQLNRVTKKDENQCEKKYIDDLTQQEVMDIAVAKCFEQGGQKPTWSEEDEVRLQACIDTLQAKSIMGKVDTIQTNWLKSLKQRYTWKPSDEQMHMLRRMITALPPGEVHNGLESLYNDLNKLTE